MYAIDKLLNNGPATMQVRDSLRDPRLSPQFQIATDVQLYNKKIEYLKAIGCDSSSSPINDFECQKISDNNPLYLFWARLIQKIIPSKKENLEVVLYNSDKFPENSPLQRTVRDLNCNSDNIFLGNYLVDYFNSITNIQLPRYSDSKELYIFIENFCFGHNMPGYLINVYLDSDIADVSHTIMYLRLTYNFTKALSTFVYLHNNTNVINNICMCDDLLIDKLMCDIRVRSIIKPHYCEEYVTAMNLHKEIHANLNEIFMHKQGFQNFMSLVV